MSQCPHWSQLKITSEPKVNRHPKSCTKYCLAKVVRYQNIVRQNWETTYRLTKVGSHKSLLAESAWLLLSGTWSGRNICSTTEINRSSIRLQIPTHAIRGFKAPNSFQQKMWLGLPARRGRQNRGVELSCFRDRHCSREFLMSCKETFHTCGKLRQT